MGKYVHAVAANHPAPASVHDVFLYLLRQVFKGNWLYTWHVIDSLGFAGVR
jgi:hypothetical protein